MKNYFDLPTNQQQTLLQQAENDLNIADVAIEKDIWICWILEKIFSLPIQVAFKGGTSLSRVYNLIQRYSEDVDLTIDYRNFKDSINLSETSRSQLKKISEQLKKQLTNYTIYTVLPYLQKESKHFIKNNPVEISVSNNGEQLRFYYPSSLKKENDSYLRDHVLLEFGVRNSTEPCETHTIKPLLSKVTDRNKLKLPQAKLNVLSPVRTFWEKATLIHGNCSPIRSAGCHM